MHAIVRQWILVILCAGAGAAFAQGAPGGIAGKLLDQEGSAVTEAAITGLEKIAVVLKDTASGAVYAGKIDRDGNFNVTGVPTGTYDIEVPIPCCGAYARYTQKGVAIKAGETLRTEFRLGWRGNLGTIGDDPVQLAADMRAKTRNPTAPAPRLPDGKPDLSGVWTNLAEPGKRWPSVPMKPWAAEMHKELERINHGLSSSEFCLPRNQNLSSRSLPYRIIQNPTHTVVLTEFITPGHRQIFMDGRKHPDPSEWNPAWYGHSIGYWEGDILVVDTVGYNEITPAFDASIHSEKLHTIERFHRISKGSMEIEIWAEDPEAWTAPYSIKMIAGLAEGEEILEWVCAENNQAPAHSGVSVWKGRP